MKDCQNCDHLPEDCLECVKQIHSNKKIIIGVYNDLQKVLKLLQESKYKLAQIKTVKVLNGVKKLAEEIDE